MCIVWHAYFRLVNHVQDIKSLIFSFDLAARFLINNIILQKTSRSYDKDRKLVRTRNTRVQLIAFTEVVS